MILGVDHVALSCPSIVPAAALLRDSGFAVKFVEPEAPNREAKRSLLQRYEPLHAIAWCGAPEGPAIELTAHAAPLADEASAYQVLLAAAPAESAVFAASVPVWSDVWREAVGARSPRSVIWRPFHAQLWHDAVGEPSAGPWVRAVLVPVANVERAGRFWSGALGFQQLARGGGGGKPRWVRVAFRAAVPAWRLDVILAEGGPAGRLPRLDAPGFPCVALLSTAVSRDAERLRAAGAWGDPVDFSLPINGRPLKVSVLRGPDGELVELVELSRDAGA